MAITNKTQRVVDRELAIMRLRELLPEGSIVFWVLRSVSRSGMTRRVDYYTFHMHEGQPSKLYLTGYMATALGLRRNDDGIATYSCDDPIYHLSYLLFEKPDQTNQDRYTMKLRAERI